MQKIQLSFLFFGSIHYRFRINIKFVLFALVIFQIFSVNAELLSELFFDLIIDFGVDHFHEEKLAKRASIELNTKILRGKFRVERRRKPSKF